MKRAILSVLLLFAFLTGFAQNRNASICRLGLTYDISHSNHWGTNKPVITTITPYSPAETAGLKQGDIIETIDGVAVTDISTQEIEEMLNPAGKSEVLLTISNLFTPSKQVMVKKECKKSNSMTENQLAASFFMYSPETTSERTFICPFKTVETSDTVNFAKFKTFAFAEIDIDTDIDEETYKLETIINESIQKELVRKGLTLNTNNPDMEVQTFYFLDKNPNYKGANKIAVKKEPVFRYNSTTSKMDKFPFLNPSTPETEAEYLLQLGFRFVDQFEVPGRILWECEANELLDDAYRLSEYARINIPLMCMQYPYVKYKRNVKYQVNQNTYNYTGISYDIDRLEQVNEVDHTSPAYTAGIRPRDIIEKIENHKMNHSAEEFSAAYKSFITNTQAFRDPKTTFTDANGFSRCMYWDTFKYPEVADAILDTKSMAPFSYLYYYAPYINPNGNNACTFNIKRGKDKFEVIIRPTIRREVTVEIK